MITASRPVPISDQLRERIETCGLTFTELAEQAGVDRTSVSRFMSGERKLSQDAIDRLCEYFSMRLTTDEE